MMIHEQIEAKLRAAFNPMYLEVVDESYRHSAPAGSESHSKVALVSDRFTGEHFPNRHRVICGTLTKKPSDTVHALVPYTHTIGERGALQNMVFVSPLCRGVGSTAQKSHLRPLALFQYVACGFNKDGLRTILFCLENAQSKRFCGQI